MPNWRNNAGKCERAELGVCSSNKRTRDEVLSRHSLTLMNAITSATIICVVAVKHMLVK